MSESPERLSFETHPDRYKHLKLMVDGPVAHLIIDIQEDKGLKEGYELKLNSYDLGVDIELSDAIQRMRFEQPQVKCVVVTSGNEAAFSSGANIFMLGASTHAFKVNFCKYTNETRLSIEDATENSDQKYIAAVNGVCSGGGYELALACDEIYLIDDKKSAVALPEVPYLGVLPGTGGLTRVVDKRKIRLDRADVFCTLAEGLKGKKAKKWNFVDGVFPASRFEDKMKERVAEIVAEGSDKSDRKGIKLAALEPAIDENSIQYKYVKLSWNTDTRVADLHIDFPSPLTEVPASGEMPSEWEPLRLFRELDDAIVRLRFNHPLIGLVNLHSKGSIDDVLKMDAALQKGWDEGHWFVKETVLFIRRVLKRYDLSAKSFFAIVDEGSCFAGSMLELALAGDRSYMLDQGGVEVALSSMNKGTLPMGSGWTRIHAQLIGEWDELKDEIESLCASHERIEAQRAEELGLATFAFDDIDWEDELRLAIEERASLSPDALTGMEASLRFCGPETMETKIFGRLSAWQNWIFQRPNAVGPKGALTLYGQPDSAEYDFRRT